jgi:MFS family permease
VTFLAVVLAAVAASRGAWSPCGLSVLTSLNPVSEQARGHRFGVTAAWYVAGATAGGVILGVLLAAGCAGVAAVVGLVSLPSAWAWGAVLVAAAVAVASDSRLVPYALPDHPRQVDERWLVAYRRWIYAGGYGLQIGAGYATYIMTGALHLMVVLAVLSGSVRAAFVVGIVFGTARGLTLLVVTRARTPERLRALVGRVDALGPFSLKAAAAASAAVAAVAAGVLAGPVAAGGVAVVLELVVLAPTPARLVSPVGTRPARRSARPAAR